MTTELQEVRVSTEPLPKSQIGLTIEIPQPAVEASYERALARLGRRVKITGFRPGKAPRAILEQRLGPIAIRDEMVDDLLPDILQRALAEHEIDPLGRPTLEEAVLQKGLPGLVKARVSVMPEIKLPEPATVKVAHASTVVDEKFVEDHIYSLAEREAVVEPVDRELRAGDILIADLDVIADGAEVEEERRRNMEAELREGVLIPELLEALPGTPVGGTVEVEVELPENHANLALAGRRVTLRMTVLAVKEKRMPEYDDELARRISSERYATMAELRSGLLIELTEQMAAADRRRLEQNAIHELMHSAEFDVPDILVEWDLLREKEDLEARLNRQGLKWELYLKYLGQTFEQWAAQNWAASEHRIRMELVLDAYSKQAVDEPSEAALEEWIREQAGSAGWSSEEVEAALGSQDTRERMRRQLRRVRALELLAGQVTVIEPGSEPTPSQSAHTTKEASSDE